MRDTAPSRFHFSRDVLSKLKLGSSATDFVRSDVGGRSMGGGRSSAKMPRIADIH